MRTIIFFLLASIILFGCKNKAGLEPQAEVVYQLQKTWSSDTILRTPESVHYDNERNVIYVSNINSDPGGKDNNGFMSKLSVDGKILELHWVDGLSAPKGMDVYGNKLYVTDVDELVVINIDSSIIVKKIPVEGSEFLNDISVDKNGKVFFTDSKTNTIYTYNDSVVEIWLNSGIEKSNGLLCEKERVLCAASDLLSIDYATKTISVINDGISGGDGVTAIGDGAYFVSEWPGEVYIVKPDSSMVSLLNTRDDKTNSADIDYIQKDSLLLVPTFFKNSVVAYKLVVN
ncbi:MAG: hypothetical protein JXB49_25870 [Bacteroidales bacterium]|nr:hypothetical protein [Bacteroidales bacterium]